VHKPAESELKKPHKTLFELLCTTDRPSFNDPYNQRWSVLALKQHWPTVMSGVVALKQHLPIGICLPGAFSVAYILPEHSSARRCKLATALLGVWSAK
jgi:hypothetical protein